MKQMTWDDYYGGFYDWSPSTQKNYTYRLSDYGPADELWEVAQELALQDEAFAAKFLEKALAAGVRFTPEQVLEMVGTVEESVLSKIAERTDVPFDREQLEEIYMMIDDASFQKISRRTKIDVFDDEPSACEQPEQIQYILPKKKKWAFSLRWLPLRRVPRWPVVAERSTPGTVTATAPTVRPITAIATGDGTTGRAISTAVNLAETRGTEVCKRYKIYIAYTKNKGPTLRKPVPYSFSCPWFRSFSATPHIPPG